MNPSSLFVATVGGSPEPLGASLFHWHPARVVFIVTPQTRDSVPGAIVPNVQTNGRPEFDAGHHDLHLVPDVRNDTGFATTLPRRSCRLPAPQSPGPRGHRRLHRRHQGHERSSGPRGGPFTLPCAHGAGTKRTKYGVNIVVSGTGKVVHWQNRADASELPVSGTTLRLLRSRALAPAADVLETALKRSTDPARNANPSRPDWWLTPSPTGTGFSMNGP